MADLSHREFFTFASVGGLANFEAKMLRVLKSMGEHVIRIPFPSSPMTEDLYDWFAPLERSRTVSTLVFNSNNVYFTSAVY
ncbi:hypothetical protein B0H10DRAFT_2230085 [Mycena sp. CBHHK59/15]|nr:hypothetical protein B0H10DRAFT_2230085 [Mycena sp. CBHHK59/15]